MSEKIEPAMTDEAWHDALKDRAGFAAAMQLAWGDDTHRENDHALAALALYGQPFGFTAGDVDWLRDIARVCELMATEQFTPGYLVRQAWGDRRRATDSLADRIAALLPQDP